MPTDTIESLSERLGVPAERIRLVPEPGTATEEDLLTPEGRYCELVDGTLVEKPMGYFEACLAGALIEILRDFARRNRLGLVAGEGHTRMRGGGVRLPDVFFVARERLPGGRTPREAVGSIPPDLAVEILSRSNSEEEIADRRRDYFASGTRLMWIVEPEIPTVRVYRNADDFETFGPNDELDGEDVLPGLRLSIAEWFRQANLEDQDEA